MSVPAGTLDDEYRAAILDFYGGLLGWREIKSLRLPDRLTIAVGPDDYINVREQASPMACSGYEHFGIVVDTSDEIDSLWSRLDHEDREVNLEPISEGDGGDGFRAFRFRYLLPLAVEVQFFPARH